MFIKKLLLIIVTLAILVPLAVILTPLAALNGAISYIYTIFTAFANFVMIVWKS